MRRKGQKVQNSNRSGKLHSGRDTDARVARRRRHVGRHGQGCAAAACCIGDRWNSTAGMAAADAYWPA
eukprot:4562699-Pleurochrysis_carterae.AAC.2